MEVSVPPLTLAWKFNSTRYADGVLMQNENLWSTMNDKWNFHGVQNHLLELKKKKAKVVVIESRPQH